MDKLLLAKKIIIYCICAIALYYVWTLFQIGKLLMYVFQLLFPLIIALFFHFLLDPLIDYFCNERIERKIVVVHVYFTLTLLFGIFCYCMAPLFIEQCMRWYNDYHHGYLKVSPIFTLLFDFLERYKLTDYLMGLLNGWTQSFVYWITNILLAMGISFYLSYDNMHLIEKMIIFLPFDKQGVFMQTLKKLKLVTYQFIKSLLLDFFFFFLMCLIPFYFIDVDLCIWLSLFISLTNLIPYIGPYIGGIPVVIYEYLQATKLGYASLVAIVVLQYIESSYLQPYLFSKCIHTHPIALIIALTFFGDLFGIVGMIFSPLFLSYTLFLIELFKELKVFSKVKQIMLYK